MTERLAPHVVDLIYTALLKSFWRKEALRKFLRRSGIQESYLATWAPEETKRAFLDRLFAQIHKSSKGEAALHGMAKDLAEQESFPDLENWEDSVHRISEAKEAVGRLRATVSKLEEEVIRREDRAKGQARLRDQRAEAARSQVQLETLSSRLTELSRQLGTAEAGYAFQDWFFDLADYFEVSNRRPYVTQGRQIDGAITLSDTTYLVELKFTLAQAGATDVDTILKKIRDKADNTMGIMVSVSGYSGIALQEASGRQTPLLLMDHRHLYCMLNGGMSLEQVIDRLRRHASQTGEAFLPPEEFGG